MPRRKISEYRAKKIITSALGLAYEGWEVSNTNDLQPIPDGNYVIKVDQAEKKRFKNGLVLLNVPKKELEKKLLVLQKKGYEHFIVEPFKKHEDSSERYIAISYDRKNLFISYSSNGGVDIEDNADSLQTVTLSADTDWKKLVEGTALSREQIEALVMVFKEQYFTLLEINPYVVSGKSVHVLDAAVEVDDAGTFFAEAWSGEDMRSPLTVVKKTPAEEAVAKLDDGSPASFNLSVLNPDGAIFLLLSGGGASVVVADEIHNKGYGKEIANYGEYSGNPNEHETYVYTSSLLQLLLASKAKKKVLFIGGAVANFTDIANTFAGVIRAVDEYATELQLQKVQVFVRRGGPRQEIGLKRIADALDGYGINGGVYDPSTSIHEAIGVLINELEAQK